jgi:hypothetical protein
MNAVRPAALSAVAVVALACGCGSSTTTPPAITNVPDAQEPAAQAPDASAADAALSLVLPHDRATVKAGRTATGSRLTASVKVSGNATAMQTVRLHASCAARSCSRFVLADADGRFTATLKPVFPRDRKKLTVTAEYATADEQSAPATVTVRVRKPAARRAPHRRPNSTPSTSSGGSSSGGGGAGEGAATAPAPAPVAPPTGSTSRGTMVVIGDSLAVGMRPWLAADLPGWHVSIDGRVGRPLSEGMRVLSATTLSAPAQTVLAISLFTNDDPSQTTRLHAAVAETLRRAGPNGCVVWATITRPPVGGVSYHAANALLQRGSEADARLKLVPWAQYTAANPGVLAADGIHPSPAGYKQRALMYAQAAQRCS